MLHQVSHLNSLSFFLHFSIFLFISQSNSIFSSKGTTDIGPGEYKPAPAACEFQVDSRKTSCPTTRFGTGFQKNKKITQKADLSEPSPGPGSYQLPGGIAVASTGTPYRSSPAASLSGRNAFGSPW